MKKYLALAFAAVLAIAALAGCSGTSNEAADTSASGITVDEQAKSISFPATATGYADGGSIHFLVNQEGSNAAKAYFTAAVTTREVYDALESIGATHGDNLTVEDADGIIEGSDLLITVNVDGTDYIPSDLVAGADNRESAPRFGGNVDANEDAATGCIYCTESCPLGITSDSAYQFKEPIEFAPTDAMPAAGTEVTVTMTLK